MMNREDEDLLKSLEQATGPGSEIPAGLDPETQGLRETWLALGTLLDGLRAGAELPDLVQPPPAPAQPLPERVVAARPQKFRRVLALAACLLVLAGVTLIYGVLTRARPPVGDGDVSNRKDAGQTHDPVHQSSNNPDLNWDDELDERITAMSSAVAMSPVERQTDFSSFDVLDNSLKQIRSDVQSSTL